MFTQNNQIMPRTQPVITGGNTGFFGTLLATALMVSVPFSAFAQSQGTVTLKMEGGEGVTGELIEYANNMFRIRARVGTITIPGEGVQCIGIACPEGTRLETTGDRLVVTSLDGSTTLVGDLLEIANNQYVLATDFGEMRIDIDKVDCEGDGCVTADNATPQFGGQVTLTGAGTTIQGNLVNVEDDSYVVDSPVYGVLRVSRNQFTCEGAGCP